MAQPIRIPNPDPALLQTLRAVGALEDEPKSQEPKSQEYDDSLEVGLAAGLDIPTSLVLSETRTTTKGVSGCGVVIAWLVVLFGLVLGFLGRR